MDLEQLIKQRDEIIAEAEKMLEGRGVGLALKRPIELQEAQAARVEGRIASLEAARAELANSIDVELKELKADLEQRRRKIDLDRKELKRTAGGSGPPPSDSVSARRGAPKAPGGKTAKRTTARKPGSTRKAAKGTATRRAGKGKDQPSG